MVEFPELNRAIITLAPAFSVAEKAPSTFGELQLATGITVWGGGSAKTIYGDPYVNWAFRAWHDTEHRAGNHPFTLEGERAVVERQICTLYCAYPRAPALWATILRAEVVGQAEHFALTGKFPCDQVTFIKAILGKGSLC